MSNDAFTCQKTVALMSRRDAGAASDAMPEKSLFLLAHARTSMIIARAGT